MKTLIWILFVASLTSIVVGVVTNSELDEKYIGFGVVGLFLIVFPLFSYYRWKNKKISDYMLTKENIEKMNKFNKD
ncbi:MAG: hypothetical protein CMC83_07515 [Flavobacteriaceae bacterium]|nr:hypothetical protein [Flavobacteriaceae bacterium]MBK43689.1 hypothetical protein [Flavobacteriaceae bacterium]|tara:strand:- start:3256 stop:3483 length:228 start_codon:yes stop_codon:yes gene_type:complete